MVSLASDQALFRGQFNVIAYGRVDHMQLGNS